MNVKIKNFQSLKDVSFEVKGLTVITGQNNTGKSACARAISGVFKNTKGNSFVRKGESHCEVEIQIDDNVIQWEKGKKTNRYIINGDVLDKVGSTVPKEVEQFNIKSTLVNDKILYPQFARQFEQIFLLDQSPSALASALSDVEIISHIDKANSECRKEIRELTSKLKNKREDLISEKDKLKNLGDENLDQVIIDITNKDKKCTSNEVLISKLENILSKRKSIVRAITVLEIAESIELSEHDNIREDQKKLEHLKNLKRKKVKTTIKEGMIGVGLMSYPNIPTCKDYQINRIESLQKSKNQNQNLVDQIKDLDFSFPHVNSDLDLHIKKIEKKNKISHAIHQVENQIKMMEKELNDLLHNIGDTCPLCDQGINHD